MKCTNCLKEIYPKDEDAGTYKERYCSEKCQSEIEDLIDNIIDGDEKPSDLMQLLASVIYNLEYAAYNLLDGKKYTDLPKGIIESTNPGDSLLIAIRDLKKIAC